MGCHHAVITFLSGTDYLPGVDEMFRDLVVDFHKIPYCATFGVSCAGHLCITDKDGNCCSDDQAVDFAPQKLFGNLTILVHVDHPHIQTLLKNIQSVVGRHLDSSFQRTMNVFGPRWSGRLDTWEIRIGDNECLKENNANLEGGNYEWRYPVVGNQEFFDASRVRMNEIRLFWKEIGVIVSAFCQDNGYSASDIQARTNEFENVWKQDIEDAKAGIQKWQCPDCENGGEVDYLATSDAGDVLSLVWSAHRELAPDCGNSSRIRVPR